MRTFRFTGLPAPLCRDTTVTALSIESFSASARVAIGTIECSEGEMPFDDPWLAEWDGESERLVFKVRRYPNKDANFVDTKTGDPIFSLSDDIEAGIKLFIAQKLGEYLQKLESAAAP